MAQANHFISDEHIIQPMFFFKFLSLNWLSVSNLSVMYCNYFYSNQNWNQQMTSSHLPLAHEYMSSVNRKWYLTSFSCFVDQPLSLIYQATCTSTYNWNFLFVFIFRLMNKIPLSNSTGSFAWMKKINRTFAYLNCAWKFGILIQKRVMPKIK